MTSLGRRAEAEGDAFILVSPAEEKSLTQIERHIGQRLSRVTLPDFDYSLAAAGTAARSGQRSQRSRGGHPAPTGRPASSRSSHGSGRPEGNGPSSQQHRSRRRR